MDSGGTDNEKETTTVDSVSENIEATNSNSSQRLTGRSRSVSEQSTSQSKDKRSRRSQSLKQSSAESEGENQNNSLNDTFSDQSDVEARIMALNEQLQKRIQVSAQLKKEQKQKRREKLMSQEKMLLKQIEVYDDLINKNQADISNDNVEAFSKPKIKSPRSSLGENQRERSLSGDAIQDKTKGDRERSYSGDFLLDKPRVPLSDRERSFSGELKEKPKPVLTSQISQGTLSETSNITESIDTHIESEINQDSIQSGTEMPSYVNNAPGDFEKESEDSNPNSSSTILQSPTKGLSPAPPVESERPSDLLVSEVIEEALESLSKDTKSQIDDINSEHEKDTSEDESALHVKISSKPSSSKSADEKRSGEVDKNLSKSESEESKLESSKSTSRTKNSSNEGEKETSSIQEAFEEIESSRTSDHKHSLMSESERHSPEKESKNISSKSDKDNSEKSANAEEFEDKSVSDEFEFEKRSQTEEYVKIANESMDKNQIELKQKEIELEEKRDEPTASNDKLAEEKSIVSEAYEIEDEEFPIVTESDSSTLDPSPSKALDVDLKVKDVLLENKTDNVIKDIFTDVIQDSENEPQIIAPETQAKLEERVETVTASLLKDLLNDSATHMASLINKNEKKIVEERQFERAKSPPKIARVSSPISPRSKPQDLMLTTFDISPSESSGFFLEIFNYPYS